MSFPILSGDRPRLLILGSMPGRVSLAQSQYYAHARNAFWWIMSELLSFDLSLPYQQRVRALTQSNVALWDVLSDCQRPGSLDANIVRDSEVANDFSTLFQQYPSLELIAFNGAAAQRLFMRHCKSYLQQADIQWVQLPSSSPAHAALSRDDKLAVWRNHLSPVLAC